MEKLKLTTETYTNVMNMLQSPDKENVVLGLICIEESDIESDLVYLLLIKKLSNVSNSLWVEHAPKKTAFLKSLNISVDTVITYKQILTMLCERKVSNDNLQFFFTKFADYLKLTMIDEENKHRVESIDITLNFKLHESKIS